MLALVLPGSWREVLALGLTLLIEIPVYVMLLGAMWGVGSRKVLGGGSAVIVVEHPLAFLLVGPVLTGVVGATVSLAVVEVGIAWLGEAAVLWLWLRRDPGELIAVSFVANALSFGLGLILFAI